MTYIHFHFSTGFPNTDHEIYREFDFDDEIIFESYYLDYTKWNAIFFEDDLGISNEDKELFYENSRNFGYWEYITKENFEEKRSNTNFYVY